MSYREALAQLNEEKKAELAVLQAKAGELHTAEFRICCTINRLPRTASQKRRDKLEEDRKAARAEREANLVLIRQILYPVVEA